MKRLMLAGMLALLTTAAHAQAYTTLGPAGAGLYQSGTQRDSYSTTSSASPTTPSARETRGRPKCASNRCQSRLLTDRRQ